MDTVISETNDHVRQVVLKGIEPLAGAFHLEFRSQLRSARQPAAWQRNFDVILQRDGLQALRDLIDAALAPHVQ